MAQKKPHSIYVTVTSISEGVENQVLTLDEGAQTPEELVFKCFAVTDAIDAAMKSLAEAGGFPVKPGKPEK